MAYKAPTPEREAEYEALATAYTEQIRALAPQGGPIPEAAKGRLKEIVHEMTEKVRAMVREDIGDRPWTPEDAA